MSKTSASPDSGRTELIPALADGALDWERLRKTLAEIHAAHAEAEEISITTEGRPEPMGSLCDVAAVVAEYFRDIVLN